jgi:hypothetical protein
MGKKERTYLHGGKKKKLTCLHEKKKKYLMHLREEKNTGLEKIFFKGGNAIISNRRYDEFYIK